MTKASLGDWIAAANPFAAHGTREQALRAARWASLSLILTGVISLVQAGVMWINRDSAAAAMITFMEGFAMGGVPPEAAQMHSTMMRAMIPGMVAQSIAWSALFGLVYLGLAKAQWDRPNRWIPIIFLILSAFAVLSVVGHLVMMATFNQVAAGLPGGAALPSPPSARMLGLPPWLIAVAGVESVLALILHTTALRGALALRRFSD